jgi:hypothetical protein
MTRVEIEGQGGELGELGCFNPILTLTSPKPKAVVIPGSGTQLPAPQTLPVPSGLGLCALNSIRLPGSNQSGVASRVAVVLYQRRRWRQIGILI